MKVLVIGGTLFIGQQLVEELLKAGHEVAVLHRKPKHDSAGGCENIMADRNDAERVREALSGRRFEVVFDNVYDWERGTTAAQVEATVRAVGDRIIALHLHVQRGRLWRRPEPQGERPAGAGLSSRSVRPQQGHHRADAVPHARAAAGLPVVTFRPPFVYGPRQSVLPRSSSSGTGCAPAGRSSSPATATA